MTRLFVLLALAPALIAEIAFAAPTPAFVGNKPPATGFLKKPAGTFGTGRTVPKTPVIETRPSFRSISAGSTVRDSSDIPKENFQFLNKNGQPATLLESGRLVPITNKNKPLSPPEQRLSDSPPLTTRGRSGTISGQKKVEQPLKDDKFPEDIFGPMVHF